MLYFCFAAFFTCAALGTLISTWEGPLHAVRILPALLLPGALIYMFVRIVATPRRRFQLSATQESGSGDTRVKPGDGPQ